MSILIAFLVPMVVLTIISVVFGANWMGITGGNFWTDLWEGFVDFCKFLGRLQGKQVPNGGPEDQTAGDLPEDVFFEIDPIIGAIVILLVIGIIAGILGIQIVGSGLSDWSVRTGVMLLAYGGLWSLLTILSMDLIKSIEVFGVIIYISLTIGYVIGVIERIGGKK